MMTSYESICSIDPALSDQNGDGPQQPGIVQPHTPPSIYFYIPETTSYSSVSAFSSLTKNSCKYVGSRG